MDCPEAQAQGGFSPNQGQVNKVAEAPLEASTSPTAVCRDRPAAAVKVWTFLGPLVEVL